VDSGSDLEVEVRKLYLMLVLAVLTVGCTRVGPGYVGIKVSNAGTDRGVGKEALTTGWVFYTPGASTVFEYPTFVQQVVLTHVTTEGGTNNDEITFTNSDQMTIAADISFAYHLEADKVPEFYTNFRSDDLNQFTHGYLKSLIRDKFNEVGGRYTIAQIMGDNGPFLKEVREAVQKDIGVFGVVMESQFGFIGAPRPPETVVGAINAKAQAQQIATQKEMEVKQAEADARKVKAKADGDAQATISNAKGQAESILAVAEAQAEANRKLQQSLTPALVEYTKIQRWDGVLPQVTSGGTPLIDLREKKEKEQ
jgi:regulator of protease activity HflC (stomatin/prohibitin superfamily)